MARGLSERTPPAEIARFIEGTDGLALDDPANADALAVLVDALAESGRASDAVARAEASVGAAPESARFQAIHADALQQAGVGKAKVRAAYERALEIDPDEPHALAGLAALEAGVGNPEAALALYARLAELDAAAREPTRAGAALLAERGRGAEAEERLAELLNEHPYDARAALQLAKLRVERGVVDARTRELAQRAVHFRGGTDAQSFLDALPAAS